MGARSSTRRIGVLTSGGDAPGMNAAIAGVCAEAERLGGEVIGFARGFRGLAAGCREVLTSARALPYVHEAGTWLGSSRYSELRTEGGLERCRRALDAAGAHGLVVIGGDGSLQGARKLAGGDIPVAFIPATIDGDVASTETTLGVDSAVNYAVGVVDQLRVTARALPGRAFVVQTLGGPTDHLALAVGVAAHVDDVLVPGRPFDLDRVAERFRDRADEGEAIAVLAEGVGDAVTIAARLAERAGVQVHPTILGHAQRAAPPSAKDRAMALAAGRAAVASLLEGRSAFVALHADASSTIAELPDRLRADSIPPTEGQPA